MGDIPVGAYYSRRQANSALDMGPPTLERATPRPEDGARVFCSRGLDQFYVGGRIEGGGEEEEERGKSGGGRGEGGRRRRGGRRGEGGREGGEGGRREGEEGGVGGRRGGGGEGRGGAAHFAGTEPAAISEREHDPQSEAAGSRHGEQPPGLLRAQGQRQVQGSLM